MTRTLPPLPASPAVLARLEPFFSAGLLDSLELHVATWLGRRVGVDDPDALLACALAVRAPRHGHICVDLGALRVKDLMPAEPAPERADDEPAGTALPSLPGPGWAERVADVAAAAALVRRAGEARTTPFVLDGEVLYTDRMWSYQRALAERVRAWCAPDGQIPLAAEDRALLDRGLARLFRPPDGEGAQTLNLQRVAGAVALLRRYAVVTGGPGMGKTWTVRNLLALLWLRHEARRARGETASPTLTVALAAPTGKAAARMREALRDRLAEELLPALTEVCGAEQAERCAGWLRDLEARTLHRTLGYRHDTPTRFRHDRAHPLPCDVVVVDEASMVDFPLMAKLVDAVGERGPAGEPTRLLLLGDRHQLASVEAGTVLADLCGPTRADRLRLTPALESALAAFPSLSGLTARRDERTRVEVVPGPWAHDAIVQFNRSHRFPERSGIAAFAAACLRSDFSAPAAAAHLDGPGGCPEGWTRLLPYGDDGELPAEVDRILLDGFRPYLELLRGGWDGSTPEHPSEEVFLRRVLQAFDGFRVLCAHRRGPTGAAGLNERALALLRGAGLVHPAGRFWTGRPVLVQANDYNVRREGGEKGLFNGDIGLLVRRMGRGRPDRQVVFPGRDGLRPTGGRGQPAFLEERDHAGRAIVDRVDPNRLPEHDTVFAMTIHKSQGSEFRRILVVLPPRASPILTRELIYTAVTRAREGVTVVADRAVLEDALTRTVKRASGLEGAVWGAGAASG